MKWLAIGALVLAVLGPWLGKLLKRRRIELEREELRQEVFQKYGLVEIKPRRGE